MRTIEIKAYNFDELSEDAQNKAIEYFSDINVNEEWWKYELEEFVSELDKIGFEDAEIHFSGFYSQGDGLCFDAKINLDKFVLDANEQRICNLINNGNLEPLFIAKNSYSNHYSYEKTRYVDYYSICHNNINLLLDKICISIEDFRLTICKDFYRRLKQQYEYLCSPEAIKETIICNDYEFTESGELI